MPKIALRPGLVALDAQEETAFENQTATIPPFDPEFYDDRSNWTNVYDPEQTDSDFMCQYTPENETELAIASGIADFILTPVEKADKSCSFEGADVTDFGYLGPSIPSQEPSFQAQNDEERQALKTAQFSNSELNEPIFIRGPSLTTNRHIDAIKPLLRRPEVGVICIVRFDPNLAALHSALPGIAKVSDQNYFLLHLHYKYLVYAARALRWTSSISYDKLKQGLDDVCQVIDRQVPHNLQVTIYPQGTFTITAKPALQRDNLLSGIFGHASKEPELDELTRKLADLKMTQERLPQYVYHLFWDTESTTSSFHTTFKTTYKDQFDIARIRTLQSVSEKDLVDVVTFNSSYGVICGRDICIAVYRDEKWYTPAFTEGAMCDPMRYVLLAAGLIVEAPIKAYDIQEHEEVIVFNASIGVLRGVFMNAPPAAPLKRRKKLTKPHTLERRTASKIISDQQNAFKQSKMTEQLPGKTQHKNKIPGTQVLKF